MHVNYFDQSSLRRETRLEFSVWCICHTACLNEPKLVLLVYIANSESHASTKGSVSSQICVKLSEDCNDNLLESVFCYLKYNVDN